MQPEFNTKDTKLKDKYEEVLRGLHRNTWTVFESDQPVLVEGGIYQGIWLECGPLESTVFWQAEK